jgi:hypothetical protein
MQVGDSFAVPLHGRNRVALVNTIGGSARGFARRNAPDRKFSVRATNAEVRCWRFA